jgi:uncharacterized protein
MTPFPKVLRLLAALVALLLCTASVRAGLGSIQDNGAFFSEPARAEALRIIGDVERNLKKDIVIETFKEMPGSVKNDANLADKAEANRVFEQWAGKQAREQHVNGIYILLVKQPAHLQVVVGNQTLKQAFTAGDRETLVSTMLAKLRAKQNDAALLEGVKFAQATMRAHAGGHSAPVQRIDTRSPVRESSPSWLPILIGIGVLWLVFAVVRSLFSGGAGGAGMQQGAGGGGFLRSMLGGMFGAAAGMWMYDQFFGSHGNASSWNDRNDSPGGGDSASSGQDTDYSGSGGSFGDDSGGGSSSGGDSGGDFGGGGDSGGGDF